MNQDNTELDAQEPNEQRSMTWNDWILKWNLGYLFGLDEPADGAAEKLQPLDIKFLESKVTTNKESIKLAWNLYQEMHTRVITRELHFRSGDEAAALKSLHSLFGFVRSQIIEIGPDCRGIATLFTHVLNGRVERFTSKWHKHQMNGDFANPELRRVFRLELIKLQKDLFPFKNALDQFSKDTFVPAANPGDSLDRESENEYQIETRIAWPSTTLQQRQRLIEALTVEKKLESKFIKSKICNFDDIEVAEREQIRSRRDTLQAKIPETEKLYKNEPNDGNQIYDAIGLSLSGGGIRACTFAMGVVQRLAQSGMLNNVDYLSTVSGGGYFGSFLSTYLDSSNPNVGLQKGHFPFRADGNDEPNSVRHIRNYASYLTSGAFHQFKMFGVVLFGILANLLLVFPLIVLLACATKVLMNDAFDNVNCAVPSFYFYSTWYWTGCITIGFGVFLSLVRTLCRGCEIDSLCWKFSQRYALFCQILLAIFLIVTAVNLIPHLVYLHHAVPRWVDGYLGSKVTTEIPHFNFLIIAGLGLVFLRLLSGTGKANSARKKIFRYLFLLSGPLLFLFSYLYLIDISIVAPRVDLCELFIFYCVVPYLLGAWLMNINFASPHFFYRQSLSNTFLIRPDKTNFDNTKDTYQNQDVKLLSELRCERQELPYHIVNCVLNAPASFEPNLRGRNSDFYVFTEQYCGSPLIGFEKTKTLEELDKHLNLGTAMAISGAAASPHSGALTSKESVFLMTLLNIRLGYWLRNPKRKFRLNWIPNSFRHPTSRYLFSEMFGLIWEKIKLPFKLPFLEQEYEPIYHNLSDGGHLENLGIYELLRRRCKLIIAVDGEADPEMHCESMMKLVRFARIDFGIEIHFEPKDFENQESGYAKSHFTLGVIDYGHAKNVTAESPDKEVREFGIIIYLKNNLTGNEPTDILDYKKRNSTFPHVHISDQFFNEEQFEAFRSLGYHVADEALLPEIFDGQAPAELTVKTWAEQLVKKLYPY